MNTIIAKKKLWKYLFLLGPFLLAAGLTIGLVTEKWNGIALAFIIPGIIVVGFWLIWQNQQSNWWGRRSTQAGTNALVGTLAMLVIVGLINFLGTRYHLRTDLTETRLFTLAPQSRELVRSLKQPVKVWVFQGAQNSLDRELLENYQQQNPNFKFEYVDPQAKPGLAEKFGVKNQGEVYLESQNRKQLVQVVSESDRLSEVKLTNRLQQITSLSQPKVYFVQGHGEHLLSQGDGAMSQAVQALGDKNYIASPLNLAEKSTVPEDAAVVVIAGSRRALFESEVTALQNYLNKGGNLLLMTDPNSDPKLDNLLVSWGVKLDNRLAVDVAGIEALGPAVPIVTEYGKHPITKDFRNGISFYPLARAIETTPVSGVEATPLLLTKPYPKSWAESDQKSEKLVFHPGRDLKGPLTLGVALTKKLGNTNTSNPTPTTSPTPQPTTKASTNPTPTTSPTPQPTTKASTNPTPTTSPTPQPTTKASTNPTPTTSPTPQPTTKASTNPTPTTSPTPQPTTKASTNPTPTTSPTPQPTTKLTESRMVVLGNSDFATDGLFGQQLNGDVFLNSVTWLSQQDQPLLSIRPKEAKNRRINLTTSQARVLALSSLLVLPLVGFTAAGVVWWRRR
ncbi:GldG family protein [Aetokthonos hydrillicola]|uniref:GldG family protein n=2 Tax=Aetokthonos hydrillicola TaxID=1550245 RepID=UPI001ABB898A|nr:Gldg family protein [Aetokthonos hydrillicola]MBO3457877.1 ABC transporter [Aetokthonos hydrillicola CCALA 1050]